MPSKPFFSGKIKLNLGEDEHLDRRRRGCENAWTKRHTHDVAAAPPLFMSATFGLNTPAHMRARRVLLLVHPDKFLALHPSCKGHGSSEVLASDFNREYEFLKEACRRV